MIALAAKANIPLITVTTSDIMNAELVLSHIVGCKVVEWPMQSSFDPNKGTLVKSKLDACDYFYTKDTAFACNETLYNWLVSHEKGIFLLNHEGSPFAYSGGELPTPPALVAEVLATIMEKPEIDACMPALQGLTLKCVSELIRLTSATGEISSRTLTKNRWMVASQVQGLEAVDKSLGVYLPHNELVEYAELNKEYFSKDTPYQLRPRGLLLHGITGTGKTLGAKYLANAFDCPLYRLDLSASLGRYVGQSEQAMGRVLSAVKNSGKSVLLIDEVEKLFGESDDSGVTYRLLAQLLWFLQEHRELIITVMTSNDYLKLPPELYRQGRIDQVLELKPMSQMDAVGLCMQLFESLGLLSYFTEDETNIGNYLGAMEERTPAKVTAYTYGYIKQNKLLTKQ